MATINFVSKGNKNMVAALLSMFVIIFEPQSYLLIIPSTLKFCLSIVDLPINSLYVFTIRIGNKQLLIMLFLLVSSAQKSTNNRLRLTILGDFNGLVPFMVSFCKSLGLKNIVDFPTRGDSILDCCFSKKDANYVCKKLSRIGMSDHCLFKCTTSAKKLKRNVSYAYLPNLSPSNRALFHNTMKNIDFVEETVITDGLSLHLIFDTLLATLTSAYDYCFPLRKIKIYQQYSVDYQLN